jgi:hypothetical protein
MTQTTKPFLADTLRIAVYAWIREDAPVSIKLLITPKVADKLIKRLKEEIENA